MKTETYVEPFFIKLKMSLSQAFDKAEAINGKGSTAILAEYGNQGELAVDLVEIKTGDYEIRNAQTGKIVGMSRRPGI
jgi:hypothetical protein